MLFVLFKLFHLLLTRGTLSLSNNEIISHWYSVTFVANISQLGRHNVHRL